MSQRKMMEATLMILVVLAQTGVVFVAASGNGEGLERAAQELRPAHQRVKTRIHPAGSSIEVPSGCGAIF
jgi:hypothetical protein